MQIFTQQQMQQLHKLIQKKNRMERVKGDTDLAVEVLEIAGILQKQMKETVKIDQISRDKCRFYTQLTKLISNTVD